MSVVETNIPMEMGQSVILPYSQNQYINNRMSKHMLLIFLIFIATILTISNYIQLNYFLHILVYSYVVLQFYYVLEE